MRLLLTTFWFFLAAGLFVGTLAALVLGWNFVEANLYGDYGLRFLYWDSLAERVQSGTLWGGVLGAACGVLALVGRFLAARFVSWIDEAVVAWRVVSRSRWIALCLAIPAAVVLLVVGLRILNEHFIPWDYTKRYWVLNGGWIVASIVSTFVLYNLLRLPKYDGREGRRGVVLATVLAALSVVVTVGFSAYAASQRPVSNGRHVLLLTVDTQRADHLSCYGYPRETSPKLDALASTGTLFENAYSHAPVTSSSFSCIHTGLRPRETGTYGNDPIRLSMPTLSEQLRNAGYYTGAIVSNFVLQRGKNYEYGFDHYDDRMDSRELVRKTPERIGGSTTTSALKWMRGALEQERPVFLWVHYQDPHGPYTPPREYQDDFLEGEQRGRKLRVNDSVKGQGGIPSYQELGAYREFGYYVSQYDSEIRYFDDSIDSLVRGLKQLGVWDDALVVFSSDHGEGMGEHDYYFAHGDYLWPGQTHVPLIVWDPDRKTDAERVAEVAKSSDIVPTVLGFAGVDPALELPGVDLRKLAAEAGEGANGVPAGESTGEGQNGIPADESTDSTSGAATDPTRWSLSETFVTDNYKAAIRSRDLMVFYDAFNEDYRAYDPREGRFLSSTETFENPNFEPMKEALDQLRNRSASRDPRGTAKGRQEIEVLKSLGYVN